MSEAISIHAPARGASVANMYPFDSDRISIHAPARGASGSIFFLRLAFVYFNSRPCERGFKSTLGNISITPYFNSRPCERGFKQPAGILFLSFLFQFTPLREGLPWKNPQSLFSGLFQFTPLREGLLRQLLIAFSCSSISIHAPARGASLSVWPVKLLVVYFNSRPCERGFFRSVLQSQRNRISIHAPARGASSERRDVYSKIKVPQIGK